MASVEKSRYFFVFLFLWVRKKNIFLCLSSLENNLKVFFEDNVSLLHFFYIIRTNNVINFSISWTLMSAKRGCFDMKIVFSYKRFNVGRNLKRRNNSNKFLHFRTFEYQIHRIISYKTFQETFKHNITSQFNYKIT